MHDIAKWYFNLPLIIPFLIALPIGIIAGLFGLRGAVVGFFLMVAVLAILWSFK